MTVLGDRAGRSSTLESRKTPDRILQKRPRLDASLDGVLSSGRNDAKEPTYQSPRNGDFLSMLSFTTNEVKGVLVVAFEAPEDGVTDWQVGGRDWLYKLIESHPGSRFAIDLSDVSYLASSEIGFLVTLKRRIDRRQGKVVIFGAQPYVTELFRTMNLIRFFDLVDSLPAALTKLETA